MNCRTCGNRLEEGDRFCQVCGTPTGAGTYNVVGEGEPAPGGPATLDEHVERAEESSGSILAIIGAFVIASMIVAATAFAAYHVYKAVIEPNLPPAQPPAQPPAAVEPQTPVTGSADGPHETEAPAIATYETLYAAPDGTPVESGYFYYPFFQPGSDKDKGAVDELNRNITERAQEAWEQYYVSNHDLLLQYGPGTWNIQYDNHTMSYYSRVAYANKGLVSVVEELHYNNLGRARDTFGIIGDCFTFSLSAGKEVHPADALGISLDELDGLARQAIKTWAENVHETHPDNNMPDRLDEFFRLLDQGRTVSLTSASLYCLTEDGLVLLVDGESFGNYTIGNRNLVSPRAFFGVFIKPWDEDNHRFDLGDECTETLQNVPHEGEVR